MPFVILYPIGYIPYGWNDSRLIERIGSGQITKRKGNKMKTFFAMQGNTVISKHRSFDAARKAAVKCYSVCRGYKILYPISFYGVAQLESPNYWERGDAPYKRYYIFYEKIA
jgi:hypothetical protein